MPVTSTATGQDGKSNGNNRNRSNENANVNATTAASAGAGGAILLVLIGIGVMLYRRNRDSAQKGTLRGSVEVPLDAFGNYGVEDDDNTKKSTDRPTRPTLFSSLSSTFSLGGSSNKEPPPVSESDLEFQLSNPNDWIQKTDDSSSGSGTRRVTSPDALPKTPKRSGSTEWSLRRKTQALLRGNSGQQDRVSKVSRPAEVNSEYSNPMANPMSLNTAPTTGKANVRPVVGRQYSNNPMNTFVAPSEEQPAPTFTDL